MSKNEWFSAATGKAIAEYVSESLAEEVTFVAEEVSDLKDVELGLASSVGDLMGTEGGSNDPVASVSYALNVAAFAVFYATVLSSDIKTEEVVDHVTPRTVESRTSYALEKDEEFIPYESSSSKADEAFYDAKDRQIRVGDLVRISEEYDPASYNVVLKVTGFKGEAVMVEPITSFDGERYFGAHNLIVMDMRGVFNRKPQANPDEETRNESVDHPDHYGGKDNPYEAIKVIEAWGSNFNVGNALKYIARYREKSVSDSSEDLRKAIWYLDREATILETIRGS